MAIVNTRIQKFTENSLLFSLSGQEMQFLIHFILTRFWSLASIWVIFLTLNGMSLQQIALINIFYWGAMFVFEVPTGVVADKFGRKASLFVSYLMQAVGIMMFAFSTTMPMYLVSFFIWGVGQTMTSGADQAWLYDETKFKLQGTGVDYDKHYQKIYGFFVGVGLITTSLAYFAGGYLANFDIRWPIILNSIFFLVASIWLTRIKENDYSVCDDNGVCEEETQSTSKNTKAALINLMHPVLLVLVATSMIMGGIVTSFFFWMQAYLDFNAVNLTLIGLILGVGVYVASIGSRKSALISEKLGSFTLIGIIAASALSFFALAAFPIYGAIFVYLVVRGLRGMFLPYMSKLINQKIPSQTRATTLSIVSAFNMLFVMIAELVSAMIVEEISFEFFYLISGIIFAGLIPLVFVFRQRIVNEKVDEVNK